MTIRADFLTVRRDGVDPATTWRVERRPHEPTEGWVYDAEFDRLPPCLTIPDEDARFEGLLGDWNDLVIEGEVDGRGFQVTQPSAMHTFVDDCCHISFTPTEQSYQRIGSLELRDTTWTKLATTGIADSTDVRRALPSSELKIDYDQTARSRAAHFWSPLSNDHEGVSPRSDLLTLVCILAEDVPAKTVAALAAPYLDLDQSTIQTAVPELRAGLRDGELSGTEVMQADGSVWRYTPAWAGHERDCGQESR